MNRTEKVDVVQSLHKTFQEYKSVLLVDFTGLDVPDSTNLRRKISETGSTYQVIKNRLALRAIDDTSLESLKEHFQGPTAIACTGDDPVALAKVLKKFISDHPSMTFKAGIVEGRAVSATEVEALAEMPSRTELISKLLFLLNSPLTGLASALQSPLMSLASLLKQVSEGRKETESTDN